MSKSLIIDLHSHSYYSDGELSPAQLVQLANKAGIDVLALTDHDTIAGLNEAQHVAHPLNMTIVPGVEISAQWKKHEIHIVGLNIDLNCPNLKKQLAAQITRRTQRALAIDERLQQLGITGAYEEVKRLAGSELIARPHFAKFLVINGHAQDMATAFHQYLGRGKPAYVSTAWPEISEAVIWIKCAGGQAVLAHPIRYRLTMTKIRLLIQEFKQSGGDGLEVIAGRCHKSVDIELMASLAQEFNLLASQGSDFHGETLSKKKLGKLPRLPEKCHPIWYDWDMADLLARQSAV